MAHAPGARGEDEGGSPGTEARDRGGGGVSKDTRTDQQIKVDDANKDRPGDQQIKDGRQGHGHRPST
jgi:hypothetical protein